MRQNQSLLAIFEIGLGLICILIAVGRFISAEHSLSVVKGLFLGVGILLFGLNNYRNKSEKGKMLSYVASTFMILGAILIFYEFFSNSNN